MTILFHAERELGTLLQGLHILSPTTYRFLNEPIVELNGWGRPELNASHGTETGRLAHSLMHALYARHYIRPMKHRLYAGWANFTHDPGFVARLQRANQAVRYPHLPYAPFYNCGGTTLEDPENASQLMRFYFHCNSAGAPLLLRFMTGHLEQARVPFRLKCLTARWQYDRADACVLYITRKHFVITKELIRELIQSAMLPLRRATPLFTVAVHAGVGFAEDPANGESFGAHRCRLLAEGVVEAYRGGRQDVADRLRAIRARFHEEGLSLDRPYLSSVAHDDYDLA